MANGIEKKEPMMQSFTMIYFGYPGLFVLNRISALSREENSSFHNLNSQFPLNLIRKSPQISPIITGAIKNALRSGIAGQSAGGSRKIEDASFFG
ncbi:MAG: hypothetical protein AB2L14_04845 [Candidatus Xenobiia bacterium LiM19]